MKKQEKLCVKTTRVLKMMNLMIVTVECVVVDLLILLHVIT
jgi:hypothetical protein